MAGAHPIPLIIPLEGPPVPVGLWGGASGRRKEQRGAGTEAAVKPALAQQAGWPVVLGGQVAACYRYQRGSWSSC